MIKEVAFSPMNEIHFKEVEILNRLLEKIEKREDIKETFNEFIEDVKNHFAFEENLMQKYNFFAYIPHKMEHDRILNELNSLNLENLEELERYFKDHFIPWLINHVETMDTVTAGFFNMVGAKP